MRKTSLIATTLTLALAGAPVVTVASATTLSDPIAHAATQRDSSSPGQHRGHPTTPSSPTGTTGTGPTTGHAYGKACATESRKHVAGHPGTPFSECVHALKTLHAGKTHSAKAACKAESHKRVKGQKGTPFSRCVAAARKLAHAKRHAKTARSTTTGPR